SLTRALRPRPRRRLGAAPPPRRPSAERWSRGALEYAYVLRDRMERGAAAAGAPQALARRRAGVPARAHRARDARVRGARRLRGDHGAAGGRDGARVAKRLL